jgi:YfiH family protein
MQRPIWEPFPGSDAVSGGFSLKSDGPMSWAAHPPEHVQQCRREYFQRMGLDWRCAIGAEQVHGQEIHRVIPSDLGRGSLDRRTRLPQTDAFITDLPGAVLTTLHADCASVFLLDLDHRAIGLVHAGWRGALAGLAGLTLRRMHEEFGTASQHVQVAIGPTISTLAYPVEPGRAHRFAQRFGADITARFDGRVCVDLVGAIIRDLLETGLDPANVPARPPCTVGSPEFASYRRDGLPVHSMMAWFMIRPVYPSSGLQRDEGP